MITSASSCALKLLVPLLLLLVDMKYTISQDDVDLVPIGSALLPPRSPSLSPTQNPPLTQPFNDERFKQRHNGPRTTTVTPEPNAINKTNSANTTDIAKLLKSKKEQEPYVGIRIRFNEPFFEETARLFYTVFSNQVKNIKIIPQRQCFQEGCFNLHSFLITGFQRPRGITLRPLAPNLLLLNIFSFDVDIKGLLHGNILLLLTAVPVSGRIDVGSRQLSITAAFDLQKNAQRVPYLRMQSCELRTGFVTTHVSELGLLTDSINLKYKADMVTKAKEMITTTICNQIEHLIKSQVNDRLRQMPRSISIAQIFSVLMNNDECKSVPVVACDDATGQKAKPAFEYSKQPIVPKTYDGFSAQNFPFVNHWSMHRRIRRQDSRLHPHYRHKRANDSKHNDRGIATITEIIPEMEEEEEESVENTKPKSKAEEGSEALDEDLIPEKGDVRKKPRHYVITALHPNQTSSVVVAESEIPFKDSIEPQKKSPSPVIQSFVVRQKPGYKTNQEKPVVLGNDQLFPLSPTARNFNIGNHFENAGDEDLIQNNEARPHDANANLRAFREPEPKGIRKNVTENAGQANKGHERPKTPITSAKDRGNLALLLDFLDLNSLSQVFIDLDFLDSSAGSDNFVLGISGDVFLKTPQPVTFVSKGVREVLTLDGGEKSNNSSVSKLTKSRTRARTKTESNEDSDEVSRNLGKQKSSDENKTDNTTDVNPPKLRFPNNTAVPRKTLEMIFSELHPNWILLQAHRARLLKMKITPQSPLFGNLLRTTCSPDEICLSDSIPEAGERFPNRQLEVHLETVRPPKFSVTKDLARLSFIGASTFLLADGSRQPIGRIPFSTTVEISAKMSKSGRLEVNLKITRLDILDDVDFFELPAESLGGFRDAVKGAIENAAKGLLAGGIDMQPFAKKLRRYGLSQLGIVLLEKGLIMLQADVDVYKLVFEDEEGDTVAGYPDFGVTPVTPTRG